MTLLKKCFVAGSIVIVLAAAAIAGGYHWATSPLDLTPAQLDVTVKPHSSLRSVTLQLNRGGVPVEPELFVIMTRLLGLQSDLKSGNYEFKTGITPYEVLQKIARGDVNEYVATIIEGWTFKRMRAELDANPALKHDTIGMSDTDLMNAINAPEASIGNGEGLFFPDTYLFDKNTSDLDVYRRAYRLMRLRLDEAWTARAPNLPYKTPYDALTMASIIEKETGKKSDRPMVAAVFANRLRVGMPLQTDPTVIYGMGDSYTGRIRKKDLQTDTPYNTYTRMGLPPTPISLPGVASLQAAMNPAQSTALYFVSRGDGSSIFSDTLGDHNKAVDKYIRGQ
ncbi:endolytic transglycosylase MltG [Paraburkholderia nemoris]|uniref:Endolytic murein transglycosylase n=1 Tax=Paraburkholderia nemoris TaxID=2793076 RepID=A0ABM8S1B1_9BURK|nr:MULTISPECIES: endolytic transglycosylase MltG [Paraburkholderia]KPD15011.1 aminodeoxychorismate lyase [Burkholderia sp. ST111]MBK5146204.1 endolytic transglycosylase MltG [Burkholderia sp. R-69608]MBK3739125.1 endolytic transglycosylase MltG [Paraburkholderia aspalathi]MBK3781499.1 endolytic transglycosylase MltG [Paraburkholderia aspalathi]MBK3812465.1 endolytic transglycosylase MltG [Paraburkholderia aspalathi]